MTTQFMPRIILTICFCLSAFVLSACGTAQKFSDESPQLVAEPDNVSALLADAATKASSALQTLAAVEQKRGPAISTAPVGDAPVELRRAYTVNWIGPVEPITRTLAERASYNFHVIGASPAIPIVVSLDVENKPVIEILRDLGLQLGLRADINVDANKRSIEIHYGPNTGARG